MALYFLFLFRFDLQLLFWIRGSLMTAVFAGAPLSDAWRSLRQRHSGCCSGFRSCILRKCACAVLYKMVYVVFETKIIFCAAACMPIVYRYSNRYCVLKRLYGCAAAVRHQTTLTLFFAPSRLPLIAVRNVVLAVLHLVFTISNGTDNQCTY